MLAIFEKDNGPPAESSLICLSTLSPNFRPTLKVDLGSGQKFQV